MKKVAQIIQGSLNLSIQLIVISSIVAIRDIPMATVQRNMRLATLST